MHAIRQKEKKPFIEESHITNEKDDPAYGPIGPVISHHQTTTFLVPLLFSRHPVDDVSARNVFSVTIRSEVFRRLLLPFEEAQLLCFGCGREGGDA